MANQDYFKLIKPYWLINIIGMLFITWIALKPDSVPYDSLWFLGSLSKYLYYKFPTLFTIGVCVAWFVHVFEAFYSLAISGTMLKMSTKFRFYWFIQTLLIGFPSLNLIRARLRETLE